MNSASEKIRVQVMFAGGVQGVGFRVTAEHIARRHAVVGFVRNQADGSVQIEVQGSESEVSAVLGEIRSEFQGSIRGETRRAIAVNPTDCSFCIRY